MRNRTGRNRIPLRRERGFTLEVVLLGALVMFILAVSILDIGARRVRSAETEYRKEQAFCAAEAGLARAKADLARGDDTAWTGEPAELGPCTYSVEIGRDGEEWAAVVSTGEFRRPNGERIAVRIEAAVTFGDGAARVTSWRRVTP
jgi:hypothetical protein